MEKVMPELQVMVCTYGREGIKRCAAADWPLVECVQYLVSWQMPEGMEVPELPEELGRRKDVRVYLTRSKGLGLNRGIAQRLATAPIALISDDDLTYTAEGLRNVMESFHNYSEPVLTFRHDTDVEGKDYPGRSFVWPDVPEGYYPTSFEIAFRTEALKGETGFNPYFGVNSLFASGEEDMLLADAQRAGLKWRYVPLTICFHPGPTTGDREDPGYRMIEAKGTVIQRLYPASWPMRMAAHILRQAGKGKRYPSKWMYLSAWLRGIRMARRNRVYACAGWYEELYRESLSGVQEIGAASRDLR